MAAVNQNDLRVKNAENLIHSFNGPQGEANGYVFIGRSLQWETDITTPMVARQRVGDMSAPYPENNWKDFYQTWNEMLSLKRIKDEDVYYMIPRITWTSGVVYDMYRHDYSYEVRSSSNAQNLYDAAFYVVNQNRDVYVCLDNNRGSQSLVEPMNKTNEPFYTSDGFQWMRLYRVGDSQWRNQSTNNFIPITNYDVNGRPIGAVYTVVIDSTGTNYSSRPDGVANPLPYYYCKIVGDGRGAVARVKVEAGKITSVRVVRPGERYTYATLDFKANRVYKSLIDLDNAENGLLPGGDGTFKSTVIISPPRGWGWRSTPLRPSLLNEKQMNDIITNTLAKQLGGTRVGVFSDLKYDTSDFFVDSTFRQIGILQDPLGHMTYDDYTEDVIYPDTMSSVFAISLTKMTDSKSDRYGPGEMIKQEQVDEDGNVITAYGTVVGYSEIGDSIFVKYIQDPHYHTDPKTGELYAFKGESVVESTTSEVKMVPDIMFNAEYDDQYYINGYAIPELARYTGNITYLSNRTAVFRTDTQTERVSIIIEY